MAHILRQREYSRTSTMNERPAHWGVVVSGLCRGLFISGPVRSAPNVLILLGMSTLVRCPPTGGIQLPQFMEPPGGRLYLRETMGSIPPADLYRKHKKL